MFTTAIQFFYPDIKREEVKKFSFLALAFVFTIGTYWLMRLLKDLVLYKLAFPASLGWGVDVGRLWIPTLKTISPLFVLVLVMVYSKLVDMVDKHKLMYIIASFYMIFFSYMTIILFLKNMYGDQYLGRVLLGTSGILGYLLTESFGSLVIALFWSFTVSSCTSDQAKRGFPFIIAAGQFGAIAGSSLLLIKTTIIWPFYAIVVVCLGFFITTIYFLMKTVPAYQMKTDVAEKPKTHNVLSGLKLLCTKPYLIGILIVSTFYEIAGTIVEYQMNSQASIIFDHNTFKWFKGVYGVSINTLAFLIALLGTSYAIRRFGSRICLLIYPVSFAIALIGLYSFYTFTHPTAIDLLWASFGTMLIVKAVAYAVNNPVKEMMYIPTSKDAKFKTKSIIDMFGSRSAKMSGAQIGGWLNVENNPLLSVQNLMIYGSLISLGFIGIWIIAAIFVGTQNAKLIEKNEIIE
ncbi:MAG TPA: Npt1/Npt2 family nucleotide transporter [Candidatus Saccharimonadales bacterium]|nr:Npt1/Npt2 family nucleotide transporter [Candidatus Saccharimonadales bacterium]